MFLFPFFLKSKIRDGKFYLILPELSAFFIFLGSRWLLVISLHEVLSSYISHQTIEWSLVSLSLLNNCNNRLAFT